MGADTKRLKPDVGVYLDGKKLDPEVAAYVDAVRVFLHAEAACTFEIYINNKNGKWTEAPLFYDAREVEIRMGYEGQLKPVFKGEVTAWRSELEREGPDVLVIRGMDRSHRLMRAPKTRT